MAVDVLVCVATGLEGARIACLLEGSNPLRGSIAGRTVALLRTGVGPVNAASAATRFLCEEGAGVLLACGIGGAYPGSDLGIGDVACAESETYADLGADSPDGFLDMEALGHVVVDGPAPLFNRLPLAVFPVPRRLPFVTRSTCTGTHAEARALASRTGGAVESMEGAAFAHAALLQGVPAGEVRAISNLVGARDRAAWRVAEAADAAQRALLAWIEEGAC